MDRFFSQADVARLLGVCEDSVIGWEMRGVVPAVRQMPNVTNMIGYLPVEIDISTIGGRITNYRIMRGITPEEFGTLIRVDASTVLDWEKGKRLPPKTKRDKIEAIIRKRCKGEEIEK